jgi:YihY family inner membrane protein
MSTASAVPETYHLGGIDAKQTLKHVGWGRLLKDSITRFRTADGFSTTRALAHGAVLTAFPAFIAIVGIASALDLGGFRQVVQGTIERLAPGQSDQLLRSAFRQGSQGSGGTALIGGIIGFLISGMFAMTLLERGFNRVYGMVRDRKLWKKLLVGLTVNVSAGILFGIAFLVLAAGDGIRQGLISAGVSDSVSTAFSLARWPVGLLLVFAALTLVYKVSPNRRQPSIAWLQTGTVMATLLWVGLTALLAWYYSVNDSLGTTYGPLLGIIALLTWAYASAFAVFMGAAFAAQLEAVRAGVPGPRTLRRFNETVVRPEETKPLESQRPALAPDSPVAARTDSTPPPQEAPQQLTA